MKAKSYDASAATNMLMKPMVLAPVAAPRMSFRDDVSLSSTFTAERQFHKPQHVPVPAAAQEDSLHDSLKQHHERLQQQQLYDEEQEEEEDEHQAGQHQRHVIPSVICWSVTSSRSNSKRSFFGDYWGNHQRPKQLNPMAPSHTEAVVVIKNNSTTTQVAVAVAAPVSSTATTATPTRRSIFSLSPSPMETLAELAAKYQPDPLNRKTKSDSMLERRPTQSLLKKSPRYSGSLYSSSVSSCTASCARPQEQSRQRSVCFHDQVKVVEYQKPMERYAAQGWENQFS
mmetsp:Transcript_15077/g.19713  ORF Transcript_15077/g.19713 Transcript_15077/m.19713 type:complete len:285 (+) Transcript_15077:88-942(+)